MRLPPGSARDRGRLSGPLWSRLAWQARPVLCLADPHTSPGSCFQETPHASKAEDEAEDQRREVRAGPSIRARRPKAAHKTDDAGGKEEDAKHKAEDS